MLESRLSSLQARLDQIEVNAVAPRTFKFGDRAERARESRSQERDTHQRQNRDASQNRSRNLLDDGDVQMMDTSPTLPPTPTSHATQQPQFVPPNPYLEEAKRLRDPKQITHFKQFVHNNNHNNSSKTDPSATTATDPTRANRDFQITSPGNLHNPQGDISKVITGILLSHLEDHKLHMKIEPGVHQLIVRLLQEVNLGKLDFKNQTTPPSPRVAKST